MYKIEVQQVSNGFIVNITKELSKKVQSSGFDGIINGMFDKMNEMEKGKSVIDEIRDQDENVGTKVFSKYKDVIGFLTMLMD